MGYDADREVVERKCATEWQDRLSWSAAMSWLNQFTYEDRIFAIKMLKHFQFLSYDMVSRMLGMLHTTQLKEQLISYRFSLGEGSAEERESVFRNELQKTVFMPLTPSQGPKSGDLIAYMYKSANNLPPRLFVRTHGELSCLLASQTKRTLVLLDDFLGTGEQCMGVYREHIDGLVGRHSDLAVVLVVCVALEEGIGIVERETGMKIVAGQRLDSAAKAFSDESPVFEELSVHDARQQIEPYGTRLWPQYPLGYGDCQLLLGFHWCPPDNTVTPIWCGGQGWTPIFPRAEEEAL